MLFRQKLSAYIKEKALFEKEDLLLLALSGGADSVTLLDALIRLGYAIEAAHCNFHLRGMESDRDEAFVRRLCQDRDIKLHVKSFQTSETADREGISIEMAARKERYAWFHTLMRERNARCILTAHHKDDSVETILLNLIRGTGIDGLTGISPATGDIRRPLLCMDREEILDYARQEHLDFVTDSTNQEDICKRNIVRHHLLPLLEQLNPSCRNSILLTAQNLQEAAKVYHQGICEGLTRVREEEDIILSALLEEPSPESLLFEALKDKGFNASQVRDILRDIQGTSGHFYHSPTHTLLRDRDRLIVTPKAQSAVQDDAPKIRLQEMEPSCIVRWPDPAKAVCLDKDKLRGEMRLRKVQSGDWFIPLGMKGKKLLSDYMTDRKFPLSKKQSQYVLLFGEDITWVVSERMDERFKVTEDTRKVLLVTLEC